MRWEGSQSPCSGRNEQKASSHLWMGWKTKKLYEPGKVMQKIPGHRHPLLPGNIPINVLCWLCCSGTQELFGVMEPSSACGRSHKTGHRGPSWWQSCFQRRGNQSQPCHGAEQGADPLLPPHCQDEPICKPKQKPELQLWADLQQGSFAVGFPLRCFLNHISLPGGLWAPLDHLELLHGISVQFYSTGLHRAFSSHVGPGALLTTLFAALAT